MTKRASGTLFSCKTSFPEINLQKRAEKCIAHSKAFSFSIGYKGLKIVSSWL
jgi:hypothetical protein